MYSPHFQQPLERLKALKLVILALKMSPSSVFLMKQTPTSADSEARRRGDNGLGFKLRVRWRLNFQASSGIGS